MGKMKTIEEYKQEVNELGNGEYEVLSDKYLGNKVHLKFKHKICGFEYLAKPNTFTDGSRCPLCAGKVRKDIKYFKKEVFNLVENEYEVIGDYIGTHTKTTFKHNSCGNIFEMSPHSFLAGQRCRFCQHRSYVKTTEEFKNEVKDLVKDEYEVLEEYKTGKTKIKFLHNKCGKEYMVTPSDFIQGYRCPKCNCSKGEKAIERFLNKNKITFIPQYRFPDCKNIHTLPFDFYIPSQKTLVEYDGHAHYMSVDYFGGDETLEKTKLRDNIKTKYCEDNHIKLIRIPYWDFDNIEQILTKELI